MNPTQITEMNAPDKCTCLYCGEKVLAVYSTTQGFKKRFDCDSEFRDWTGATTRSPLCRERERRIKAEAELAYLKGQLEVLKTDSHAVHVNMLRGTLAKLSRRQFEHLIGGESENAKLRSLLERAIECNGYRGPVSDQEWEEITEEYRAL